MAWIRDEHGDQTSLSDEALIEEIRTGEIRPEQEVRHPVWTHNRFQPVHTVAELQAALTDPRAVLAARMRRRWRVPWGTLLGVGLAAAFLEHGPEPSWTNLLDLISGAAYRPYWMLDELFEVWLPLQLLYVLPVLALAWYERAFGVLSALTPAVVMTAPALLLLPPSMPLWLVCCLAAAIFCAVMRHSWKLTWRRRGGYGWWYGALLLPALPIAVIGLTEEPMMTAVWLACCLGAGLLSARLPPLTTLVPARRRRHTAMHLGAIAVTLGVCAGWLHHVAQHPERAVSWTTHHLEPAGITVQIPHFPPDRSTDSNGMAWLHDDWHSWSGGVVVRAQLVSASSGIEDGVLVREAERDGVWGRVTCDPQDRAWAEALCEEVLRRVTFSEPYTTEALSTIPDSEHTPYRRRAMLEETERLVRLKQHDDAARLLAEISLKFLDARNRDSGALTLGKLWLARPDLRPEGYRETLIAILLKNPMPWAPSGHYTTHPAGLVLLEEPCADLWLRTSLSTSLYQRKQVAELLDQLSCPDIPRVPERYSRLGLDPRYLDEAISRAVRLNDLFGPDAAAEVNVLLHYARQHLECGDLAARIIEEMPPMPREGVPDRQSPAALMQGAGCEVTLR